MTKENLLSLINSEADLEQLSSAELMEIRAKAKANGILNGLIEENLAIAINNRTYKDIEKSNDYTPQEKELALEARNEYNTEIRTKQNARRYNAKEIMSRAHLEDGVYHFSSITVGEMNFLIQTGALDQRHIHVDKDYKIGQEKDQSLAQILQAVKQAAEKREAAGQNGEPAPAIVINEDLSNSAPQKELKAEPAVNTSSTMPVDLQKSYNFWNKFNEKTAKTGLKYDIENIEDKHLLVEAKKGNKTIFKGIDHGSKGFDILARDKDAEPYEMFDVLVKKAKIANPKTVVRIKDNVKDPILRNMILIACARNNIVPVGNLPEGFDFEALKEMVKELNTTEEINQLAKNLYNDNDEFSLGLQEQEKDKTGRGIIVPIAPNQDEQAENKTEKKDKEQDKPVVIPIINTSGGNGGSGNSNNTKGTSSSQPNNQPQAKEGFWKKAWEKSRKWIVGGLLIAASFFGVKSCQQGQQIENDKNNIENLTQKNDSLMKVIDLKDKIISDQELALVDCGKKKEPAPVVKKKKVVTPVVIKKKEPVKQEPVKKEPVKQEPVKQEPVKKEPVKQEPVKQEPVKQEPVKQEPVKKEPVKQEPQGNNFAPISLKVQHGEDNDFANPNMGAGTSNGSISLKKQHTGEALSGDAAATRSVSLEPLDLTPKHGSDDDLSSKGRTATVEDFYRAMNGNGR